MNRRKILIDNINTMINSVIAKDGIMYYIKKVKSDVFLIKNKQTNEYDIITFREFIDNKYILVYYDDPERNETVGGHDDYEFTFDPYVMAKWYDDVIDL